MAQLYNVSSVRLEEWLRDVVHGNSILSYCARICADTYRACAYMLEKELTSREHKLSLVAVALDPRPLQRRLQPWILRPPGTIDSVSRRPYTRT